jgi:hypothetical protein
MWGDDSAEDLLETHREGGDEDVAKHEAREGAWEEGDGMGMIGDHKPVRMTRQRSLSIPDSLAGLVSGLDASGKKVKASPLLSLPSQCFLKSLWFGQSRFLPCSPFSSPVSFGECVQCNLPRLSIARVSGWDREGEKWRVCV